MCALDVHPKEGIHPQPFWVPRFTGGFLFPGRVLAAQALLWYLHASHREASSLIPSGPSLSHQAPSQPLRGQLSACVALFASHCLGKPSCPLRPGQSCLPHFFLALTKAEGLLTVGAPSPAARVCMRGQAPPGGRAQREKPLEAQRRPLSPLGPLPGGTSQRSRSL